MFSDNTLTPKEALRLCALGTLALSPQTYAQLATAIRHFVSRVVGPTPEIMGHSIELLKYEGLIEPLAKEPDPPLRLTPGGHEAMRQLLLANLRTNSSELNKLIVALKFRFLHLLSADEQCQQIGLLADAVDRELVRLLDLRARHAGDGGALLAWLDHDIDELERRLDWLRRFVERLPIATAAGMT